MNRFVAFAVILLCLSLVSCSKDKNHGEDLPASIQALIDNNESCVCLPYVNLYEWSDQEVYLLGFKGPACDWMPAYYNNKGEEIKMQQGYTLQHFLADGKLVKNIWSCEQGLPK